MSEPFLDEADDQPVNLRNLLFLKENFVNFTAKQGEEIVNAVLTAYADGSQGLDGLLGLRVLGGLDAPDAYSVPFKIRTFRESQKVYYVWTRRNIDALVFVPSYDDSWESDDLWIGRGIDLLMLQIDGNFRKILLPSQPGASCDCDCECCH